MPPPVGDASGRRAAMPVPNIARSASLPASSSAGSVSHSMLRPASPGSSAACRRLAPRGCRAAAAAAGLRLSRWPPRVSGERGRGGEQPLLQHQRDQVARPSTAGPGTGRRSGGVSLEQAVAFRSRRRCSRPRSRGSPGPGNEACRPGRGCRLQSAHHHLAQSRLVRLHAAREPLRVEHRQQRLPGLRDTRCAA